MRHFIHIQVFHYSREPLKIRFFYLSHRYSETGWRENLRDGTLFNREDTFIVGQTKIYNISRCGYIECVSFSEEYHVWTIRKSRISSESETISLQSPSNSFYQSFYPRAINRAYLQRGLRYIISVSAWLLYRVNAGTIHASTLRADSDEIVGD